MEAQTIAPHIEEIFDESIAQERKVATLYRLFAKIFSEEADFWACLAEEEEEHAVIIHSAKEHLFSEGLFPLQALDPDLDNIRKINTGLDRLTQHFKEVPPTLKEALLQALELEMISTEYYYSFAMNLPFKTPALELLRSLTGENRYHVSKIMQVIRKIWR